MEDTILKKLTLKEAVAMLDPQYSLVYVDYRDQIEDVDILAEIVATGYSDKIDSNNWIGDQQWESANQIMLETFKDFDIEDIEDDLRSEIWDRDDSTPIDDLLRNTGDAVVYYDFDVEIDEVCLGTKDDLVRQAKLVAKTLKISYAQHETRLKALVANACGGKLTLLFKTGIDDFAGELQKKYMVIQNPEVCIMNRWQGSGYSEDGFGDFKVRLDRTRFKVDEAAPGYSFAGDVCGMVLSRATTIFTNDRKGVIGPMLPRELSAAEKQEMAYEKKWNETKECSFGDMDITRHAETPYRNEFPCGNKCVKCGTFWVD